MLSGISKYKDNCHSKFIKSTNEVPSNSLSNPVIVTPAVLKMSEKATNNKYIDIQPPLEALYSAGCQHKISYLGKKIYLTKPPFFSQCHLELLCGCEIDFNSLAIVFNVFGLNII